MARTLVRRRSAEAAPAKTYTAVNDTASEGAEEETAPKRGRRQTLHTDEPKVTKPEVKSGWDAADEVKGGDFANDLSIGEDAILIKFLDDEPFAVFSQHWIERKGKKSWICLGKTGCPLCEEIGDKPAGNIMFNVVDFTDPERPVNAVWTVRTRVGTTLKALNKDKKSGPLNRDDMYFSVSRTSGSGSSATTVSPVKARDLVEDWEIEPLTTEEIDEFDAQAYGSDIVEFHTAKQLAEIADELLD